MIYFSVLLPIMSSLFMIQRCRYVSCTEYLLHAFFFCVDDTFWIAFFFLVCLKSWKDIVPPCFVPFCTLPVSTSNELLVLEAKTPPGVNHSWVSELLGKDNFFSVYSSSIHNFPEICLGLETSFNKVDVFYWKYKENIATDCHCYCRSGRS
jgi:hypothetical protein